MGICSIWLESVKPRTSGVSVFTSWRAGNDLALQFDVTARGRRGLDSQQKVGGLKTLRFNMQNVFSRRQIADGESAGGTGRGLDGCSGDSGVRVISAPLTEAPRGPVIVPETLPVEGSWA